jgi:hypothetical protein
MVHGVKLYESLYGELNNQLSKESFQVKITNDEMVKINCSNSENYRKAIHVCEIVISTSILMIINKLDQFELWQRACITRANWKTL